MIYDNRKVEFSNYELLGLNECFQAIMDYLKAHPEVHHRQILVAETVKRWFSEYRIYTVKDINPATMKIR